MKTLTIKAEQHATVSEALQYLDAAGHDCVVSLNGNRGYFSMRQAEFNRLDSMRGVISAQWFDHHGKLVSVPR